MTSNTEQGTVGTRGRLINHVEQVSQDSSLVASYVKVTGTLQNISNINIHGHVNDAWIDGFKFSDDGSFNYDLDPNDSMVITEHEFYCPHNDRGDLTVNFQVNFGFSGDGSIGNNQYQWCQLVLDHIKVPPTRPQNPVFSNRLPTSVTISWDAPHDDGGSSITGYTVERYNGDTASGTPKKYGLSSSRTRNFTDLSPGQDYTYLIYAHNNTKHNNGVSDPSVPLVVVQNTGVYVRKSGVYVSAVLYVRYQGVWVIPEVFVRTRNVNGSVDWRTLNNNG
jgi:hypothetical protein